MAIPLFFGSKPHPHIITAPRYPLTYPKYSITAKAYLRVVSEAISQLRHTHTALSVNGCQHPCHHFLPRLRMKHNPLMRLPSPHH
jgi:hypothetical protein